MRLVTFVHEGETRVGAETGRGIVDFRTAAPSLPATMVELLVAGPQAMKTAHAVVARALDDGVGFLSNGDVTLLAPLPRPGKILGIGLNYREHAGETGREAPQTPIVFSKAVTAVIGPGAAIHLPAVSSMIDYEGEMAVVIGARARSVSRGNAMSRVAGYTVMNDVTARDYQQHSGNCMGKSFDTFAPMGPAIVTLDEISDPQSVALRTVLSGEEVQHGDTRNMIFDVPTLIEFLSAALTLEPGDVITTGTPAGVGMRRNPPRFLKAGDTVRVEVAGVGVLENPVVGG
ncbi:MAG: fumarylacetoacetate hydrolase family protein [Deltaproteobacteria bacterium]|nr:fumarylacetoacetate hydrolase family protein [Deltaproteobacteria bacterium]